MSIKKIILSLSFFAIIFLTGIIAYSNTQKKTYRSKAQEFTFKCPDFNKDGIVDKTDVDLFTTENLLGKIVDNSSPYFIFDINNDSIINTKDVSLVSQKIEQKVNELSECLAPTQFPRESVNFYRTINIKMNLDRNELYEFYLSNNDSSLESQSACGITVTEENLGPDKKNNYSVKSGRLIRKTQNESLYNTLGDCVAINGEEEEQTCNILKTTWKDNVINQCKEENKCALSESPTVFRPSDELICGNDGVWHSCNQTNDGTILFIDEAPFQCYGHYWRSLLTAPSNEWEFETEAEIIDVNKKQLLKEIFDKLPEKITGYYVPEGKRTSSVGSYKEKIFSAKYYNEKSEVQYRIDFVHKEVDVPPEMRGSSLGLPDYSPREVYAFVYQYNKKYKDKPDGSQNLVSLSETRRRKDHIENLLERSVDEALVVIINNQDALYDEIEFKHQFNIDDSSASESGKIMWTVTDAKGPAIIDFTNFLHDYNNKRGITTLPVSGPINRLNETDEEIMIVRDNADWIFTVNGLLTQTNGIDPLGEKKQKKNTGNMWFTIKDPQGKPLRVQVERKKNPTENKHEWGYFYTDKDGKKQWFKLTGIKPRDIPYDNAISEQNNTQSEQKEPNEETITLNSNTKELELIAKNKYIGNSQTFTPITFTDERGQTHRDEILRLTWEGKERGYILEYYDPKPGIQEEESFYEIPEEWPLSDILETLHQNSELILEEPSPLSPSQLRKANEEEITASFEEEVEKIIEEIKKSQERAKSAIPYYSLFKPSNNEVNEALAKIFVGDLTKGIEELEKIFAKNQGSKTTNQILLYLALTDVFNKDYVTARSRLFQLLKGTSSQGYEAELAKYLLLKVDSFVFIESAVRFNHLDFEQWKNRLRYRGFYAGEEAFNKIKNQPINAVTETLDTLNPAYFIRYMSEKAGNIQNPIEIAAYEKSIKTQGLNLISLLIEKGYAFDITTALQIINQNGTIIDREGKIRDVFGELGIKEANKQSWSDPKSNKQIYYTTAIFEILTKDPMISLASETQKGLLENPYLFFDINRQANLLHTAKEYQNQDNFLAAATILQELTMSDSPEIAKEASNLLSDIEGEGWFNMSDEFLSFGIADILVSQANPAAFLFYGKVAQTGGSVIAMTRTGDKLLRLVQIGKSTLIGAPLERFIGEGNGSVISRIIEEVGEEAFEYAAGRIHPSLEVLSMMLNGNPRSNYYWKNMTGDYANTISLTENVYLNNHVVSPILRLPDDVNYSSLRQHLSTLPNTKITIEEFNGGFTIRDSENHSFAVLDSNTATPANNVVDLTALTTEVKSLDWYSFLSKEIYPIFSSDISNISSVRNWSDLNAYIQNNQVISLETNQLYNPLDLIQQTETVALGNKSAQELLPLEGGIREKAVELLQEQSPTIVEYPFAEKTFFDRLLKRKKPLPLDPYQQTMPIVPGNTPIIFKYTVGDNTHYEVINMTTGSKLDTAYNDFKSTLIKSTQFHGTQLNEIDILQYIYDFIKKTTPVDFIISDTIHAQSINRYVDIGETCLYKGGVCRHHGPLVAALIGRAYMEGLLPRPATYRARDGHAWAQYRMNNGEEIVLDVTQNNFGPARKLSYFGYDKKTRYYDDGTLKIDDPHRNSDPIPARYFDDP